MDDDFLEFVEYVEDNLNYLPVPRFYIRDMENPLERYTNDELLGRYCFSRRTITVVLMPLLYPHNVRYRRGLPIPPLLKLCIALRFFATGSFQRICGDLQHISQATVCRIVKEVATKLARNLGRYVKFPNRREEIETLKREFHAIAGFPGVIGCIDGTHIEIINPGGPNAEVFRNRKSWMSLNVQVVVGPSAKILDLVTRWPGSTHDSRIFNNSSVKVRLETNQLSGILLGDSAYAQSHYMFTPVLEPQTQAEHCYNRSQIVTRNVIERAFGQWKQRFRCLQHALLYKLNTSRLIIAAVAVLHNIAIDEREQFVPDPNYIYNAVPVAPLHDNARENVIRNAFILRHFTNDL